ncbi:MAG: aminomethyl-transferring glycine dehydrogenase [Propioniciclava sp.]
MTAASFLDRHLGPTASDREHMLGVLGLASVDALVQAAVPASIRTDELLFAEPAVSEAEIQADLGRMAAANEPGRAMIGLGYHGTITPAVIRRTILENPAWYTAYTPYQPEISQGRLEMLLTFQTMVADLTALPTAGSSLLDEATAVAEAVAVARRQNRAGTAVVVDSGVLPPSVAVLRTRAHAMGIEVRVVDDVTEALAAGDVFAVVVQTPATNGQLAGTDDLRALTRAAHAQKALVIAAADLLSLTLRTPPGEWGADIAVGSTQRFGVPLFYGGPHAGYIAVRAGMERQLPGRLVGLSKDRLGADAFRLALQTREQHIRRERATSNICTSQVLLAVAAAAYAVHHGPDGLRAIAQQIARNAGRLAAAISAAGHEVLSAPFFDTVTVRTRQAGRAAEVVRTAREAGVHLRLVDADTVGISVGEDATGADLAAVAQAFGGRLTDAVVGASVEPERTSAYLTHPVFHSYRSETELLRYLRALADRDFALDRGMIPLGSCTMKLNPAAAMEPISYPGFANLHPFVPTDAALGYAELIERLETQLTTITGYDRVSLQPNAGSQGEFAGLLAVSAYHRSRGEQGRRTCLIPASAHGTNAASAAMAGLDVVVVATAADGSVDHDDLRAKIAAHADDLAVLMITYPSTHGVYEAEVVESCALVHDVGGQVYVDGANLNALLGLARPGRFGADVSHLNLHKTFAIPHGGGGPGVGPVAVREHLAPFLPNHPLVPEAGPTTSPGPVAGAPWGSAGILPISYAFIALLSSDLRLASETAVLSANYLARRLGERYPVLYSGEGGWVAHECLLDLRPLTKETGITVDDVAKRLIDYGFHAPTMSFPVSGTLMVEPTESESLAELDRFIDAMVAIADEVAAVASGVWPAHDNPLVNAPHPVAEIAGDIWDHPYPRSLAAFPGGHTRGPVSTGAQEKYFPAVARIDGAWGDRNLVCSCPPVTAYEA